MAVILVAAAALAAALLVSDQEESARPVTEIRRNDYGKGSVTRTLKIIIDGKEQKAPMEVEVEEKRYTQEQIEEVFQKAVQKLEPLILGGNRSLDEVRTDLNLVTEIPGEPIEVSWELNRYDLINR